MRKAGIKQLFMGPVLWMVLGAVPFAHAQNGGSNVGGGGSPMEMRVYEIRQDILKWISLGGSKALTLPAGISHGEYESKMLEILSPKQVTVSFVNDDSSSEEELRVRVDGRPKTCRGFQSKKRGNKLQILCNAGEFAKASPPAQYRLIHHEYAGLTGLERNEGAWSDYEISNQLTDYLKEEKVLRLAVKKANGSRKSNQCSLFITPGQQLGSTLDAAVIDRARYDRKLEKILAKKMTKKGYKIAALEEQARFVVTKIDHDYPGPSEYHISYCTKVGVEITDKLTGKSFVFSSCVRPIMSFNYPRSLKKAIKQITDCR